MSEEKTVLLIEDNPYNREITEITLEKAGFRVISAVDGEDGLNKLENNPDIVLLDLSLPKVSGWDIIKQIRGDDRFLKLPVIAFTAHAMVGDREKAMGIGCSSYIAKPVLPEKIVSEVKSFFT